MAVEARRGCGYRKVGGLYMVGGELSAPCGRLPHPLHVCPTCSGGIKQTRGWTWVKPVALLATAQACNFPSFSPSSAFSGMSQCAHCPMLDPSILADEEGRCGLLWIGEGFYKTPEDFSREGAEQGVCRRITAIPRGFKVGETWVLVAHPKVNIHESRLAPEQPEELAKVNADQAQFGAAAHLVDKLRAPAIFAVFRPTRVEKIITVTQSKDEAEMKKLEEAGITAVVVPDDDKDHQGSVYDKDEKQVDFVAEVEEV